MDPDAVRGLAEHYGFEEAFHCSANRLLLLETPRTETRGESGSHVVAVWYDAGTVGVILPHPRRRRVQSFFFNVPIPVLREILAQPNLNRDVNYVGGDWITHAPSDVESEESALRRQLAALEFERTDIAREKAALQARLERIAPSAAELGGRPPSVQAAASLADLEERRKVLVDEITQLERQKTQSEAEVARMQQQQQQQQREEEEVPPSAYEEEEEEEEETAAARAGEAFTSQKSVYLSRSASSVQRDSPARFKGNRCLFSFSNDDYQEEFGKAWSMKPVNCVALGRGYIIVYEDGGLAWWDVPSSLDRKFRNQEVHLPPVQFVALGPDGNFFIKFTNGKMEWVAKPSFQRAIKKGASERALYVDKVAFGANGSWVILWTDGSIDYEGAPRDLAAQLDAVAEGPGLRDVSLGPHGEWFVIFKDHSVQANNLLTALHSALARIKQAGGRVRSVAFGEMNSWYVRYWDGS